MFLANKETHVTEETENVDSFLKKAGDAGHGLPRGTGCDKGLGLYSGESLKDVRQKLAWD